MLGQVWLVIPVYMTPSTWGHESHQAWDDVEVEVEVEGGEAEDDDKGLDDALALCDTALHGTQVLDGNASCGRLVLDSEVSHDILDNCDTQALGNGALVHRGGQILVCNANLRASAQHRRWV